eukprot:2287491-Amphidinium_carterae.1
MRPKIRAHGDKKSDKWATDKQQIQKKNAAQVNNGANVVLGKTDLKHKSDAPSGQLAKRKP